ncbi:MAG: hypothetical protein V8Q84_09525 [Bilophila sp.]
MAACGQWKKAERQALGRAPARRGREVEKTLGNQACSPTVAAAALCLRSGGRALRAFFDRFHAEGWDALFGSDAPFTLLFTVAAFSAVTMEIVKTLALRRLYLVNAALSLLLLAVVRWLWSFSS